ncbi:glycosyltransferase family 2 protein [bacterium]|nr:glycosyltransferase family 2 protein [bacterium]
MTLLYIYLTIFTVYYILLALVSMKTEKKIRDKYTPRDMNLCVVVYATGHSDTLENLIKQLKHQTYPKRSYTIYAILDKCENVSEVTLQSDLNVNVININNLEPIGKSQAYSIIAEKLQDVKDLDAYVFIDAKNYVDSDFMENINFYLMRHDVFFPMVNYLPQVNTLSFWENVKSAYSRYVSKFILRSRTMFGLTNILDTNCFVIKKDLLNRIANFDFRDMISETKYTLKLAQEGIIVPQIQDLRVYTSIDNFDIRIPSLSNRLSLFWSNVTKPQNLISREFLISLAAPNWCVCILGYYLVLNHASKFLFMVSSTTIFVTALILILAFCVSLMNSKLYAKEYLYLLMYPFLSIARMTYNFPPFRGIRNIIKQTTRKHIIETMTVNAIVSDGVHDYPCQLELISDDGLAKITFVNKGKRYTTKNNHLRMIDAVRELSTKLSDYGLNLKVCQCCKYFQTIVDGSTNMVKGCCKCQFQGRTPGDMIPTLIWNTCPKFEEQNVVNLF